jgi:hypothetical protein
MQLETIELHEVYTEALRLHKLSWKKHVEGKKVWYRKDVFEASHLPDTLWSTDIRLKIYDKLRRFERPMFIIRDNSGAFGAVLNFNEALNLILNPDFLNVNYKDGSEVDLAKYRYGANIFRIQIINEIK